MQTKVRIFYDDNQVCGIVIPDEDEALDKHHKKLVGHEHKYVDLSNEEYLENVLENKLPDMQKLFAYVSGQ